MGQTVNLLAFAFGGSNPSVPTGEFLNQKMNKRKSAADKLQGSCCYSSVAEHFLGKEEVSSSNLDNSSNKQLKKKTNK